MITVIRPGQNYTWAGLVLRDEAGNLIAVEVENPHVKLSVEISTDQPKVYTAYGDDPILVNSGTSDIRYEVTVSGIGIPWSAGRQAADTQPPALAVGVIGAPSSGKTVLDGQIKQITQSVRPASVTDWGEYD